MRPAAALAVAVLAVVARPSGDGGEGWPQWGGPARNFAVRAEIAASWPASGPNVLWRRPLGDGFSAIVGDGATIYTTYRAGNDDVAAALEAATGKTVWESRMPAPFNETCSQRLGAAPRAAPLIAGTRLITVSAGGLMQSLDRASGAKQWSVELVPVAGDAAKPCGYSTSPLLFGSTLLTTAGGQGRGVVALDIASGRQVWASQDFDNGYSSPLLIDLDGKPELVVFTAGEISGLDPATGALEWTRPHPADYGVNVAMPVWGADGLLFVSSAYNGGSRVLKLARKAGRVEVTEVWSHKRVRLHFGNAVRIGDRVYAANGDFGAAPLTAVDVRSGELLWRDRTAPRATVLAVGDKLVLLGEDGTLVLATPGPDGLTVNGRAQILNSTAWTPPTLANGRLFLRDRTEIVALDLR